MDSNIVLEIFKEITKVPRESGHEEQIIAWLNAFAASHGLESRTDEAGNVLIIKEASKGKENVPTLVLQCHSDMVCEKNAGSSHDFSKDPVPYTIEDGWMVSHETTLGADDGIGMACALALVSGKESTGRLEALFTVSEETGLDGAKALKKGFVSGRSLINLDNEDEGEICVGCAGGLDTTAKFRYSKTSVKKGRLAVKVAVDSCMGGHSGDDINRGRASAVVLLGRMLYRLRPLSYQLLAIDGGNKRNAIAREAWAVISLSERRLSALADQLVAFKADVMEEFGNIEKNIQVYYTIENGADYPFAIDAGTARRLVDSIVACPHGVLAMSQEIPGFVETSTNLASVKMTEDGVIRLGSSQRSCNTAARRAAGMKVEANFVMAGAYVEHEGEYPGWAPAVESPLRDACISSYRKLFGKSPKVRAIHAGLECGLFTEQYPDMDMIAIGPTLKGVHAPGERLDLASLDRFVKHLEDLVTNF